MPNARTTGVNVELFGHSPIFQEALSALTPDPCSPRATTHGGRALQKFQLLAGTAAKGLPG